MDKLKLIIQCHFGLEKLAKREINKLGLEIYEVVDGEVKAYGGFKDIPRLNINLRTCERVLIEVGNFKATTFEELFENAKKVNFEDYVPSDGAFPITKANSDKNSKIYSSTTIQSMVKKAAVERLMAKYAVTELPEDGKKYPFRVKVLKDIFSIRLDTTGPSLHKRGYRISSVDAPLEETLAAALIMLTDYRYDKVLVDPFTGSGTFPIEAYMYANKIAPGLDRAFISETWGNLIKKEYWKEAYDEAKSNIINNKLKIYASDIDSKAISIAKSNFDRAGCLDQINIKNLDVKDVKINSDSGIIICNPPYGERMENIETIKPIYEKLKIMMDNHKGFNKYILTSYEETENILGKATRNRKIYNGMLKTYFYTYEV